VIGGNASLTPSNNNNMNHSDFKKQMVAAPNMNKHNMESTFDGDATLDNLDVLMSNKIK
jgi:hypothetical protein